MKLFALALIVATALGLVYCQSDYQELLRNCKAQGYAEDTCVMLLR